MYFEMVATDFPDDDPDADPDPPLGFLYLSKHPGKAASGMVGKQVWLHERIVDYKGPSIYLHFDKEDELIGMEILE